MVASLSVWMKRSCWERESCNVKEKESKEWKLLQKGTELLHRMSTVVDVLHTDKMNECIHFAYLPLLLSLSLSLSLCIDVYVAGGQGESGTWSMPDIPYRIIDAGVASAHKLVLTLLTPCTSSCHHFPSAEIHNPKGAWIIHLHFPLH